LLNTDNFQKEEDCILKVQRLEQWIVGYCFCRFEVAIGFEF